MTRVPPPEEWDEREYMSERSGMVSMGGMNVVERDPELVDWAEWVDVIVRMVRIEPVGEPDSERLGMLTERSRASLKFTQHT